MQKGGFRTWDISIGNIMMTSSKGNISALLALCAGNSPVTSEFPHKGQWRGALMFSASLAFVRGIHRWPVNSPHKGPVTRKMFPFDDVIMGNVCNRLRQITMFYELCHCPACRTTLVATRFRVAVICPIMQVPHCIRVFFYFVWFVFINHIFQFYHELYTYCNILDIYLS